MSRTKKLAGLALVGAFALGLMLVQQADARPQYNKAFKAAYSSNEAVQKAGCMACHPMKDDKKVRNDYGSAVGKLVGEKNQKDEAKIGEALKKAEGEKSSVEGKTFGDLLKDGKLPGDK